jgi:hypothetical protein
MFTRHPKGRAIRDKKLVLDYRLNTCKLGSTAKMEGIESNKPFLKWGLLTHFF